VIIDACRIDRSSGKDSPCTLPFGHASRGSRLLRETMAKDGQGGRGPHDRGSRGGPVSVGALATAAELRLSSAVRCRAAAVAAGCCSDVSGCNNGTAHQAAATRQQPCGGGGGGGGGAPRSLGASRERKREMGERAR